MDSIRLRKLSHKSVIGFGKFSELSVSMLMSSTNGRSYLRWVYFNSNKISFLDEILDELRITAEYRIEKPGVNPDLHDKLKDYFISTINPNNMRLNKSMNKREKVKRLRAYSLNNRVESKLSLANRNRWH